MVPKDTRRGVLATGVVTVVAEHVASASAEEGNAKKVQMGLTMWMQFNWTSLSTHMFSLILNRTSIMFRHNKWDEKISKSSTHHRVDIR